MATGSVIPHMGARVFQSGAESILVAFGDTSVIGMTAAVDPDDLTSTGFAVNTLAQITRPAQAANLPPAVKEDLDTIFDQVRTTVILNLVDEGDTAAETIANTIGDVTAGTGIHAFEKAQSLGLPKPKLLIAPGLTTTGAADGIASVAVSTPGSGYNPDTTTLTVVDAEETGTGAVFQLVYGLGGSIDSVIVAKPGYGYDGALTFTITDTSGDGADATFTGTIGAVMNPVVAEAIGVTEKLRAVFYTDGPDSTDAAAVAAAQKIGSQRIIFCDPRILKSINGLPTPKYSSPAFAGQQAWFDKNRNLAWPATNRIISGIQGTNRPVEYGDQANNLVFNNVNTIINDGTGFITWGPFTCAPRTSLWQFVNVVRVADLVNESIEKAFRSYVGRPMILENLDLMVMDGRQALQGLEVAGVLLSGSGFGIAEHGADDGPQGIAKFWMRYEPPAPIIDIRIEAYRNPTIAYEILFDSVTGQVAIESAL